MGKTQEVARSTPRRRGRRVLVIGLLSLLGAAALWTWWAEDHPREERRLRVLVHDRLAAWFPRQMALDDGWHGLHPRTLSAAGSRGLILLIHGLDEPGTIWDDLAPALGAAGAAVWEFRYPNDQGIDRSADFLAQHWSELPAAPRVVLIGHSMGGLVARDFVSRLRHPVGTPAPIAGPAVAGVILVGTPNQGSEWARLRLWLELRDQFAASQRRPFPLFAPLRDGTGEAKIDLRPGSDFLQALNARPWPESVPIRAFEGRLLTPSAPWSAGARPGDWPRPLAAWWSGLVDDVGDGVVTLESARLPAGTASLVPNASHRGMLRRPLPGAAEPPVIAPILATLRDWHVLTESEERGH